MSNVKFDSHSTAEDVRRMTMQWGYTPAPVSRRPEKTVNNNDEPSAIMKALNPVFNFASFIAGAATGMAILVWLAGFLFSAYQAS